MRQQPASKQPKLPKKPSTANRVMDLRESREAWQTALAAFEARLGERFPGCDRWAWYRACDGRSNENPTYDAAVKADTELAALHDEFIRLLHFYYRLRDGPRGVLGGRWL